MYQSLIPGSMLAVPKNTPEVVVTVNKMRSGCSQDAHSDSQDRALYDEHYWNGCSFNYLEDLTPVISYEWLFIDNKDAIFVGDEWAFFVEMPENTTVSSDASVSVGGVDCPITEISDFIPDVFFNMTGNFYIINVEMGEIPAGEFDWMFNEPSLGTAWPAPSGEKLKGRGLFFPDNINTFQKWFLLRLEIF